MINAQEIKNKIEELNLDTFLDEDTKNIRLKILQLKLYKINEDNKYFDLLNKFLKTSDIMIEKSNGIYQLEETIRLNKISLKGYILESDFCKKLSDDGIENFTLDELKKYLLEYKSDIDIENISIAINMYETITKLESIENNEVKVMLENLEKIYNDKLRYNLINEEELDSKYNIIINDINNKYDSKILDEISKNCLIEIVNKIFDYHKNGNRKIK